MCDNPATNDCSACSSVDCEYALPADAGKESSSASNASDISQNKSDTDESNVSKTSKGTTIEDCLEDVPNASTSYVNLTNATSSAMPTIASAMGYNDLVKQNQALHAQIQELISRLASTVDDCNARMAAQQHQFETLIELIRANKTSEAIESISKAQPFVPMEVDPSSAKRSRSDGSSDEQPFPKKVNGGANPNQRTIINGRYVHGGKSKATRTFKANTTTVIDATKLDTASNSIKPTGSTTGSPDKTPPANSDEESNDSEGADGFTVVKGKSRRSRKNQKQKENVVQQPAKTRSASAAGKNGRQSNNAPRKTNEVASTSAQGNSSTVEAPKPPKPYKKPPPITVAEVYSATQVTKVIEAFKGQFELRNSVEGIKIYPANYEVHPKICMALGEADYSFHSHDLQPHKSYRVVLKGIDALPEPEITYYIKEAVETTPTKVTLVQTKSSCFYIVEFKASEVDAATLANVNSVHYYRVRWEPLRNKRRGPTQCTNCCAFGHGQMNCSKFTICLLCADDHKFSDCPLKKGNHEANAQLFRCINCTRGKLTNTHAANSPSCPSRAKHIENRAKLSASPKNRAKKASQDPKPRTPTAIHISRAETPQTAAPVWNRSRLTSRSRRSNSQPRSTFAAWFHSPEATKHSPANKIDHSQKAVSAKTSTKDSWQDICAFMATAYERIMAAATQQEQRQIAFEILASS